MFLPYMINNRMAARRHTKALAIAGLIIATLFTSCAKQTIRKGNPVELNIINALNNGVRLYANYSEVHPILYVKAQTLPAKSSQYTIFEFPEFRARYFAAPDTLAKDQPVFENRFKLTPNKSYTLCLIGDKQAVEHLLLESNYKAPNLSDSVTYMRVINLSNDRPVSVNLKGQSAGSLINSLAYKVATDFVNVPAKKANDKYDIEFRDAVTGDLLATHSIIAATGSNGEINRFLNRNWTLAFMGKRNTSGVDAPGFVRIQHQ